MRMTESFCKEQAALQREKAANEPLENRRAIALNAAKVWEKEAELAHKRDAKQTPLDKIDAKIIAQFAAEDSLTIAE